MIEREPGINRRQFLKLGVTAAGTLFLANCSPSPIKVGFPETKKNSEKAMMTEEDKKAILDEIYNSQRYGKEILRKIEDCWINSCGEEVIKGSKGAVRVSFQKMRLKRDKDAWSVSEISTQQVNTKDGGFSVRIQVQGFINPFVLENYPQAVVDMTVKHEAAISFANLIGVGAFWASRGVNFSEGLKPQFDKIGLKIEESSILMDQLISLLIKYSEVCAELRDTILLLPLVGRNPDGSIPLYPAVEPLNKRVLLPKVGDKLLLDHGMFAIGINTIGKYINSFKDISQVQEVYSDFRKIPNWSLFESQIINNLTS